MSADHPLISGVLRQVELSLEGEGRVLLLEGSGSEAKAQVQFNRHGMKWLALALAACQGAKPGPEQYGIFRM